jgi:hypothetical protein
VSSDNYGETRQERRERKLKARRERMQKHGAGLRQNIAGSALNMARRLVGRSRRRR